ncbi:hypothetical protein [Streptomyces syringium]|uniref:hypothetical protein n=1 Tax=Streptomyces syringium TaxID=76729 RepID=UPI0034319F28
MLPSTARQHPETVELSGAFDARDPDFTLSQERNQLIVHAPGADLAAPPELAAQDLGPRQHFRITVLDEAVGEWATPRCWRRSAMTGTTG